MDAGRADALWECACSAMSCNVQDQLQSERSEPTMGFSIDCRKRLQHKQLDGTGRRGKHFAKAFGMR